MSDPVRRLGQQEQRGAADERRLGEAREGLGLSMTKAMFLIGWLHDLVDSYRMPYAVAGALSLTGAFVLSAGGPASVPDEE